MISVIQSSGSKKSFLKNKHFLDVIKVIGIIVVLIAVLYPIVSCDAFNGEKNLSNQTTSTKTKTFGLNERVIVGSFSYKVTSAEKSKKYGFRTTDNTYVILNIEAVNISKNADYVSSNFFVLVDNEGRQHEHFSSEFSMTKDINPGLKTTGKIAFEVPNNAKNISLAIRDNMFDFGGAQYSFVKLGLDNSSSVNDDGCKPPYKCEEKE